MGIGWRAWSGFVARDTAAVCVAGMVLGDIHLHFTWQAWHKVTSNFVWRGRRGTYGIGWRAWSRFVARDAAAVCVAGVVLGDILLHFTWQAWHKVTSNFVLRGRRGTYGIGWRAWSGFVARDAAAVCVAGVVLGDIHLHFTWQAWHKLTSTVVLRGRHGTYGTGWRAWSGFVARDAAAVCVAGVVLGDIHLHFTWQAWHKLTSTAVLRGRRGTYRTGWRAWSGFVARDAAAVCVAGVVLGDIHLHFTWQAWHKLTSTVLFAWQAWHHLWHTLFHTPLCHTPSFTTPSSTHHFVTTLFFTHNFVTHYLWHTIFHTPLGHTPSLTHPLLRTIFVTLHLSHTIFHHTILHTPLCHTPSFTTPSFTYNFVTPSFTTPSFAHNFVTHHLSPHHLSHTTLSHTIFHTQLCHTLSFTQLSHTPYFTHCFVTHLHTIFLRHTPSFTFDFVTHNCFNFSILHHLLCLSFLLRPCYNLWRSLLEEVALWGYPVL